MVSGYIWLHTSSIGKTQLRKGTSEYMLLHYTNKNSSKPSHMPGCKSYAQIRVLFLDGSYITQKVNITFSLFPSAEPDRKVTSKIRWPVPQVKEGNDIAGYMLLRTAHYIIILHKLPLC